MSIVSVKSTYKEIINSSKQNILITGSREQSKTDIMLKRLVHDLDNGIVNSDQVLFFVVDNKQVKNLNKKLNEIAPQYLDSIAVLQYQDFFYKIYTLLHLVKEVPNNLVNTNFDEMSDMGKIGNIMEIVYSGLDMDFGRFPINSVWKSYVNFTYNYGKNASVTINQKEQQKLRKFYLKFHQVMLEKKLITDHQMINKILQGIKKKERRDNLANFMNNITHIYCDDVHFLTKKEWRVLIWLIIEKSLKYIMSCDTYYLPERLLDLENNRVGIDLALQHLPIQIMNLTTKPILSNTQQKVYSLLTSVMTPIVPITTAPSPLRQDEIDEFSLFVTSEKPEIVHRVIEIISNLVSKKKKIAIFQDNPELIPLVEAAAMISGIPFYKKTRGSFWTNPHNSFLSCYVSFLNSDCDVNDISYFFENIIPNYHEFEKQASAYLELALKKGFKEVNIHDFIDITIKNQTFFFNAIKELINLSVLLKEDFETHKREMFNNQWVKKYALSNPLADITSSTYVQVLLSLLNYINFGTLSNFCSFLNSLEDREFYNPKWGFLICDRDLFDYSNYDDIIVITSSNNVGSTIDTQTHKTHSLLYQIASSFKDTLHVFVENKKEGKNFESIIDSLLESYK